MLNLWEDENDSYCESDYLLIDYESIVEIGRKFDAAMMLCQSLRRKNDVPDIVIPTREEWIGLNLMERDGEV